MAGATLRGRQTSECNGITRGSGGILVARFLLRVEKRNRGPTDCEQLEVLVGHLAKRGTRRWTLGSMDRPQRECDDEADHSVI